MINVTKIQMENIKACLGKPLDVQSPVFNSLALNPYDQYEYAEPSFNVVIYKSSVEYRVSEVRDYPSEYDGFTIERIEELEKGSELTANEIVDIKNDYIEDAINDEFPVCSSIVELTDGETTIAVLYFEQMWGQGGLNINEFLGFFEDVEKAQVALDELDLVKID